MHLDPYAEFGRFDELMYLRSVSCAGFCLVSVFYDLCSAAFVTRYDLQCDVYPVSFTKGSSLLNLPQLDACPCSAALERS